MPIGPYKNFAACVAAQKKKGHSDESARKICGEIEKRTKQSNGVLSEKDIQEILAESWILNSVLRHTNKD